MTPRQFYVPYHGFSGGCSMLPKRKIHVKLQNYQNYNYDNMHNGIGRYEKLSPAPKDWSPKQELKK